MKIVAIADLHGDLSIKIPKCDLLLIAGDICPTYDHDSLFQKLWLDSQFREWLEKQPADEIAGVAGNHDFYFEHYLGEEINLPWHYLMDKEETIKGLRVYGTPWQPAFCDWAFNKLESELMELYNKIPVGIDILITHGPPLCHGDTVTQFNRYDHLGSKSLLRRIETVTPRLNVFGHIHTGDHRRTTRTDEESGKLTTFINVSVKDEHYKTVYEPTVIEDIF